MRPETVPGDRLAHDAGLLGAQSLAAVIGVDEAGRGCLAGEVFAGAVRVGTTLYHDPAFAARTGAFRDSKCLGAGVRDRLFANLQEMAASRLITIGLGTASVEEIETHNILGATRLAMARAVQALPDQDEVPPARDENPEASPIPARALLLVDGRPLRPFPFAHRALVGGDDRSLAIAMASILAKVSRDRRMRELARRYPGYGWESNMGYGTEAHREALRRLGPCPMHRTKFLRKVL